MDTKVLRFQILKGSIPRRIFFRTFVLASAISIVVLLRFLSTFDLGALAPITDADCVADWDSANVTHGSYLFHSRIMNAFWGSYESLSCKQDVNLTVNVITELMGKQFLDCGAKSLCIGEASPMAVSAMQRLGFSNVSGVRKPRLSSPKQKKLVYDLNYQGCSFDFVFSRDLDKVSAPALLVLEVERILKPGGIGALLVGADGSSNPNDLIRSVSPVSSLLRSSTIVHVRYISELNLVVFKKRSENASSFSRYALPADCPSLNLTKPFIDLMEPLVEERPPDYEKKMSYLPKVEDFSGRKRLVYIDVGVGELPGVNATDWFIPSYPIDQKAFRVYFVHHNTSILLSHVKRPGITFVYHPRLDGKRTTTMFSSSEKEPDPFVGEEEFDFLAWFKETVKNADFVVLKMIAGGDEMKFLSNIFESGAICFVDELFLGCADTGNGEGMKTKESCMNIYRDLRSIGVYVHQWWGDAKV